MTGTSRRTVLRGLAAGVAGPLLLRAAPAVTVVPLAAACAPGRDTVQIVVVWSGRELEMFRRALNSWEERPPIQLISAGNGIDSLIRSRIEAGNPPHIAVLPQPGLLTGLVADYPDDVVAHPHKLARWPGWPWRDLLTVSGTLYGVWLKATHKSVFWHRLRRGFDVSYQPGTLHQLRRDLVTAPDAVLGVGAGDGWVLTDWFENALLGIAPGVYRGLTDNTVSWDSPEVAEALRWLGEVWSIDDVLSGGPQRALLTQYDQAAIQVLGNRPGIGLTFEGDFIAPALAPYQKSKLVDLRLGTFRFPPKEKEEKEDAFPLVVGGDFAVLLKTGDRATDTAARRVVEWLAGPEAARLFAAHGFLTIHEEAGNAEYLTSVRDELPASNLPNLLKDLAGQLRNPGSSVEFDLSDQLKGRLAGGDGQGIWRLFQDFFFTVTRPDADINMVVDDAQRALAAAAPEA
ncbi:MAG TPA: ABC transporter substrate-binding protein [Micromonosporaceae bacterium]